MRVSQTKLELARINAAAREDQNVKNGGCALSAGVEQFQNALLDHGWSETDALKATASIVQGATIKLRGKRNKA